LAAARAQVPALQIRERRNIIRERRTPELGAFRARQASAGAIAGAETGDNPDSEMMPFAQPSATR